MKGEGQDGGCFRVDVKGLEGGSPCICRSLPGSLKVLHIHRKMGEGELSLGAANIGQILTLFSNYFLAELLDQKYIKFV